MRNHNESSIDGFNSEPQHYPAEYLIDSMEQPELGRAAFSHKSGSPSSTPKRITGFPAAGPPTLPILPWEWDRQYGSVAPPFLTQDRDSDVWSYGPTPEDPNQPNAAERTQEAQGAGPWTDYSNVESGPPAWASRVCR